jgi:hypothetical protein
LAAEVRALAHLAADAYRGTPEQERVDELARRIDEPVRVAVLGTVDDDRRMLVEALVGVPAVPDPHRYADPLQGADPGQTADPGRVGHAGQGTGPGSRGDVAVRYAYGARGVAAGPDAVVVTLAAPALRAVTLVDVPLAADGADRVRTLLGPPGPPVADAVVLLLHYGRAADAELLDRLHAAGQRGAIGVLVRGDGTRAAAEDTAQDTAQDAAEDAAAEYAADPQVRRVCEVVTPVSPSTALAAARLGDDEYRALRAAARPADGPGPRGDAHAAPAPPEVPPVLLERLGPTGARRALRLVRSGDGATRAELAAALVAHSGVADLQDLIASRFTGRADVLRTRSVLAGLEGVLRAAPPGGDAGRTLRYQLERVRAGAHELREAELLDLLRSGDLPLPDDALRAAELLLGSDGADVRTRLGLHADATVDEVRAAATRQPARWRELASHPMTSSRVREACRVLVRTCEQLVIEVDDPFAVR